MSADAPGGLAAAPATAEPPAPYSLRDFAGDVAAAAALLESASAQRFRAALATPVRRLLARDDLLECGLPRPGNNVAKSWYLYYDGTMSIVLFKVPMQPAVQPHDHGIWETLFVWRGQVRHTVYERTDDRLTQGRAKLVEREAGVLGPGDFAVVAPPTDIHGFHALDDDTYGITVSSGQYKPERIYYNLEAGSCEIRRPVTLR
jgi:predicted metal-dependent enzyme (double-stranded beta helix superfamily)